MNLGFGAGGHIQPPTPPIGTSTGGGSSHRRGSIWEPRVDLVIAAAQYERRLRELKSQEVVLREKVAAAAPAAPHAIPLTSKQKRNIATAFNRLAKQTTRTRAALAVVTQKIAELDDVDKSAPEIVRAIQAARTAETERIADIERRGALARAAHAARAAAHAEQVAQAAARAERQREQQAQILAKAKALELQQLDEAMAALVIWLASE